MREFLARVGSFVSWHRRFVAAGLAMLAIAALAHGLAAPKESVPVVTLARDVAAGQPLVAADLEVHQLPIEAANDNLLSNIDDAIGHSTAVALPQGTSIQPQFLSAITATAKGMAVVPIKLADDDLREVLVPGTQLSLVAAGGESVDIVASGARVVALPAGSVSSSTLGSATATPGKVLLVEVSATIAPRIAWLGQNAQLSIVFGEI